MGNYIHYFKYEGCIIYSFYDAPYRIKDSYAHWLCRMGLDISDTSEILAPYDQARTGYYFWGYGTKRDFKEWAKENYINYKVICDIPHHHANRESGNGSRPKKGWKRGNYIKWSKKEIW